MLIDECKNSVVIRYNFSQIYATTQFCASSHLRMLNRGAIGVHDSRLIFAKIQCGNRRHRESGEEIKEDIVNR